MSQGVEVAVLRLKCRSPNSKPVQLRVTKLPLLKWSLQLSTPPHFHWSNKSPHLEYCWASHLPSVHLGISLAQESVFIAYGL